MSRKRKIVTVFLIVIMIILDYLILTGYQLPVEDRTVEIRVTMTADIMQDMQIFYLTEDEEEDAGFDANQSVTAEYEDYDNTQTLVFSVPINVRKIRLDFSAMASENVISNIEISYKEQIVSLPVQDPETVTDQNDVVSITVANGKLLVTTQDGDPYLVWDISEYQILQMVRDMDYVRDTLIRILLCVGLDFVIIVALYYSRSLWSIPKELVENRRLVFSLAKNDFKTKYAGSYLGIFWAFVQPIVTVVLYWFVFEKGLKAGGVNTRAGITAPFVLWLIAGLVPWFFFQDSLNGATNALVEYNYLVKKVVFKISILPIVKIISAIFVHVFFVAFMFAMYLIMGFGVHFSYIQVLYYSLCIFALSLGVGYATCAIAPFFRDITQVINIVLQVGTWLTPIMWNIDGMELPSALLIVFKLNPMYYVVQGYRAALIEQAWFWETPVLTGYFWGIVVLCFVLGTNMFRRLQVHFADVL